MSPSLMPWAAAIFLCGSLSAHATPPPMAPAAPDQPASLRVLVKDRVATVILDRAVQQVVLEEKTGPGWKPLAVSHVLPGGPRVAVFKLARVIPADQLRAQGYRTMKFPARFRQGSRSFERPDLSAQEQFISVAQPNLTLSPAILGRNVIATATGAVASLAAAPQPTVVESDIWQISGRRLYFFNQYRGLQILDLADPAQPVRLGNLRLPASGEQMFLLDAEGTQVALLGRSSDKARLGQACVWLIRVTDGVPALIQELPLEGVTADSRLVGSTLHVVSNVWGQGAATQAGETVLTSLDLADLTHPVRLGTLRFPGDHAVLQAAGGHLLVATSGPVEAARALHLVSTASGSPALVKSLTPRGQVMDKFKMSVVNGAVVVVSQRLRNWASRETWVEAFPLAGSTVSPLSSLELEGARGESLHATRFDGSRLYVVTFRQVDPLFVVDLADPAAPVLSGVLEVPGWSTYLEPMGDRLLAVGLEEGKVTVSLFDVTDAAAPALLSRLYLGADGLPSWSEATYDEKAVEYLPEQGVVMVPFESWTASGGHQKAVQVVEMDHDELIQGPVLEHGFTPRRGSLLGEHFVTISGQELRVHDLASALAGEPVVRLPLAWRVDRIVPVGDYLVQIEDGQQGHPAYGGRLLLHGMNMGSAARPTLRISLASDPDALVDQIELGDGPILGVTQQGSRLYLAQWGQDDAGTPGLHTLVLELSSTPPVAAEVARAFHPRPLPSTHSYLNLPWAQPLWVTPQRLVWHLTVQQGWQSWLPGSVTIGVPLLMDLRIITTGAAPVLSTLSKPGPLGLAAFPTAVFCPLEVTASGVSAGQPVLVESSSQPRDVSPAVSQGGFVFFSHDLSTQARTPTQPLTRAKPVRPLIFAPRVTSWLSVLDWREQAPVVRAPVSIPGQLLSVAQADGQGAVILTQGGIQVAKNRPLARVIHACAYDGVSAWQLDRYITSTPAHTATAADGLRVYLAREAGTFGVVGVGCHPATGRLSQINSWSLAQPPELLHISAGHLLASGLGILEIASIRPETGALTPLASFDTPASLRLRVDRASFTPALDLWVPAGEFGVEFLQRAQMAP